MATTDLERLVVTLEANLKQYLNGLAKAQGTTASAIKKMEADSARGMARVERSFAKAGNALAGFGKGLVIGGIFAAVAGLENIVRSSITSAAAIGDLSEKLGITSDKLQELQYGAVQANMGFDELESSLLRFSKSLGQARNGQGDLLKTLEANGFDKAKIQAMSYSEALDTVANLVKNAATEQDAMLIITQAFGKGGDEMLEFLRNGSAGLQTFATEARGAGAVIEQSLIKSAQAFDDAWSAAILSIKSQLGNLVLSAVPVIQQMDAAFNKAARDLGIWMGTIDPATDRSRSPFVAPLTQSGSGKGDRSTKIFDPQAAKADAEAYSQAQKEKSDAIKRLIDFSIENQQRAAEVAEEAADRQLELDQQLFDSKMALAELTVDAFEAIVIGGEKAEDVLKNLVKQLASAAIRATLLGQGPLAGLFGTGSTGGLFGNLFGGIPGKASGGPVSAGKAYMVGEKGRELFVPSQSGTIIPNGKSGGQNVVFAPRIDARGADAGAVARLTADLRTMQRDFARNVRNTVSGEKALNPRFAR